MAVNNKLAVNNKRAADYGFPLAGAGLGAVVGALASDRGNMLRDTLYGAGVGGAGGLGYVAGRNVGEHVAGGPGAGGAIGGRIGGLGGALLAHVLAQKTLEEVEYERKRKKQASGSRNQKTAGVHGHFIHAVGLSPQERKYLNQQAAQIAKWRQGVYQSQLEQLRKEWGDDAETVLDYQAGGSSNFRDDVLEAFQEKYPKANVWAGNALEFQKRGPRRWFGLRAGKQLPAGQGYAVLMSHYPKEMLTGAISDNYQPDYDIATDFYGDVDPDVHAALSDLTGGRYKQPQAKKTASEKQARNMGLSDVPTSAGPDQITDALFRFNQLRSLVRPTDETLKGRNLSRKGFQRELRRIASGSQDKNRYELSKMAPNPALRAALAGAAGLAGTGALTYADGLRGLGTGLAGTGLLAGGAYLHGLHQRNNFRNTSKLLKDYGLLRPQLLRQAYPLLGDDYRVS